MKFINILIGLLLAAFLGAAWWIGFRPLPQTSGRLAAPVARSVTVERDARGIPTIAAQSLQDLMFTQGFVTAQDRLWQMESLRRAATGTLSEVIGRSGLAADREARTLRIARIAEWQAGTLSDEDRAVLAAYARGVNHYIRTQRGNYPAEFRMLQFDPRPWRIEDTLSIGLLMFRTLSTSWQDEVEKAVLLEKGDREKVDLLFAPRAGRDVQLGSNAWAVRGGRSANGKAMLANDPHLEHGLPGIWHAVRLRGAGLDVFGVTVPGVPCVVIGRNAKIAWGITNLGFDVQDLFRERLDPATGRYLYQGQIRQAELDRELIPVKGEAPQEFTQWVTAHGPVLRNVGQEHAALQWSGAAALPLRFAPLALNRAGNWQEFREAVAKFPAASSNVVYADAEGNIGLQVIGQIPIRRGRAGDLPVDGSSGENDWVGFIPFEELPSVFNPPSGRILTANQNPFPLDYKYPVNGEFAPPYRAEQIEARLEAQAKWTSADMIRLQADVYSGFSHHLAQYLVQAWERRGSQYSALAPAIELLRTWNGQMMPELAAPLLVTYTDQHLRRLVAERAANRPGVSYHGKMGPAVVETLISTRPLQWFADWDTVLLQALREGVEQGSRSQGPDVRKWRYGYFQQITIQNRVLEQLPYIGKYFDLGPFGANGSGTTVKQTTLRVLPSMRMVTDFGDLQGGLFNLLAGESGHPFSGHYKDQWEAYQNAESFPMFSPAAETLLIEPAP